MHKAALSNRVRFVELNLFGEMPIVVGVNWFVSLSCRMMARARTVVHDGKLCGEAVLTHRTPPSVQFISSLTLGMSRILFSFLVQAWMDSGRPRT